MAFVQPLDLALILQSAQNFTANKMKREDRDFQQQQYAHKIEVARKEQEAMVKLKQAQAKAFQASAADREAATAELASTDPDAAMAMQKYHMGVDAQKREAEAAEVTQAKAKRTEATQQQLKLAEMTSDVLGTSIGKSSTGEPVVNFAKLLGGTRKMEQLAAAGLIPQESVAQMSQAAQQMLAKARQAGPGGQQAVMQELVPQLQRMSQEAQGVVDLFSDPEKMQRYDGLLEKAASMAAADLQMPQIRRDPLGALADPQAAPVMRKYMQMLEIDEPRARATAAGKKGTTIVQMPGTAAPTRQHETAIQERLDMSEGFLMKSNEILPMLKPEFFGIQGDVRGIANKTMGYLFGALPTKQAEWQRQKQEITTFGTMMLYDLIVAMSGKAVTDREFQRIQKAVGDPDSMTFDEYKSAVLAIQKVMNYSKHRYQKMLQPGSGQNYITDEGDRAWIDEKISGLDDAVSSGAMTMKQAEKRKSALTQQLMLRIGGREARGRLSGQGGSGATAPQQSSSKNVSEMTDEELAEMAR